MASNAAISMLEEQWKNADMEKELIESSFDERVRYWYSAASEEISAL